jgi:hypothetical protein
VWCHVVSSKVAVLGGLTQPGYGPRRARESSMSRKKISTTIYITPEQNDQLKVLHERTKVPVAVYIREGIDLVLQRHSDQLPGQLSLDVSENQAPKKR